ncbi:MAG TPA: aminotransferase class III-fold pyridoxal phosphate-dependent enzyme, partial [Elusimicrobiota bacterium]|nr:aminotransferase class III-fold pyridoxal phosphate-dependent enzyme [Elusimicrobiota bacterium]
MSAIAETTEMDWRAEEERWVLPTYGKFPFVIRGGQGHFVEDEKGNRYLDLYSGHAVTLLGHCPKPVVDAIRSQAGKLIFYSNLVYSEGRARAAHALVELCGVLGGQVFFCNSGTEANESALRIARLATGRGKVVATYGSFHGRTAGSLAVTGLAKYKFGLTDIGLEAVHVPFGDIKAARAAIKDDVAAVIVEPIQSMSGIVTPTASYLQGLARACKKAGALLIFDEVQTGLGRVGAPTAAKAFGVKPDLLTFAKALGSGVPCGAVVATKAAAGRLKPNDLGSTFGGGPLACAAMEATLGEILETKAWLTARRLEGLIRKRLSIPLVKSIRGKGLMLGLLLAKPAR